MKASITLLNNGTVRATLHRWLLPNRTFQRTKYLDGSIYWSDINSGETFEAGKNIGRYYNLATRFEILYTLYMDANEF